MEQQNLFGYKYKSDGVNSSIGILIVRLLVGTPISLVAGFVGNIFNGIIVPSPTAGDELAFLARVAVLGYAASAGGMIAWFNALESKTGTFVIWFIAGIGGLTGATIAYFIGSVYIEHVDVYILNQQLTQVVIMGAAIGSNVVASIVAVLSTRAIFRHT